MSADRAISIRIVTDRVQFSDLFIDFVANLTDDSTFEMTSVAKDDNDLKEGIVFSDFGKLKEALDYRQSKKYYTYVTIYSKSIAEAIFIGAKKLNGTQENPSYFQLEISPGVGERTPYDDRATDYGFYLNWIIPRLTELDCYILEVHCEDRW